MRIITLIENLANSPKLVAEHGLSLYIETDPKKYFSIPDKVVYFFKMPKHLASPLKK
ncbi:MAG: hypothetical protein Q8928_05405 [Bacteroidota bacterium]|nr:hypothetical protein [Bacteroidota bacterium]